MHVPNTESPFGTWNFEATGTPKTALYLNPEKKRSAFFYNRPASMGCTAIWMAMKTRLSKQHRVLFKVPTVPTHGRLSSPVNTSARRWFRRQASPLASNDASHLLLGNSCYIPEYDLPDSSDMKVCLYTLHFPLSLLPIENSGLTFEWGDTTLLKWQKK